MDFTRKTRPKVERKPEFENVEQLYPHNVMLYKLPPIQEIKIQEFEDLALERLKVLRIFEQASSRNLRFLSDEYKENIAAELNREGLKGYLRLFNGTAGTTDSKKELDLQARRRDYISHFILRLAYCGSQDLKRWFIKHELDVFRYKFAALTSNEIKQFLELNKMNYVPLNEEQKNEVKDGLYESTFGQSVNKIELLDFYKVHFTEVLDLIRSRKCYLKNGYAYVNTHDFVSIVAAQHQTEIDEGLQAAAQKLLPEIENDDRLFHLLKGLHTSYTGKDYTLSKNANVPIESLDQLSKKSFPLCMRACHERLRSTHHHKYFGRMQYGLFLKGIGVTLEDSLRFWREEFTKKLDLDTFEKRYAYNVRHNYGKEGSMINYTPYSCMKIITSSVGPSDTHGCPFRHSEQSALKMKINTYGFSAAHVQEIMSYVYKGHYQIACSKYFEISHETKLEQGINHPNQYFELSQTIMGNREPTAASTKSTNSQQNSIKKSRKSTSTGYKKNSDDLMNANDDDELWNVVETQEIETKMIEQQKKPLEEWDDEEFDVTLVESMEC